jgi:hypothetical protein
VKISNSHLNDLGAQVKEGIMSVVIENLDGVSVLRMSSRDVIKFLLSRGVRLTRWKALGRKIAW